jgi:hypothetical protein
MPELMVRWKRRYNQPWYYLPRVWIDPDEATKEFLKLRKGGASDFYRIELVELNPKVVEHGVSPEELAPTIPADG